MQINVTFYLVIVLTIGQIVAQINNILAGRLPEDALLNTTGLAVKYGHPPEVYDIVTEDGYILTLYRLPGKSNIPILLTHGLQDSSDTWLLRGNKSLAITLANDGQDVWLANNRGNRYSRRHKYLDPDTDTSYWKFSFHEMGCYDLPAIIDVILMKTGAEKITAIGHSQGNTIYFALGAYRKYYNSKINVFIALAPVVYLQYTRPPVSLLIKTMPLLSRLIKKLGLYEIFADNDTENFKKICATPIVGYAACAIKILFPLNGFDPEELEPKFYQIPAVHFPAGGSSLSILHFLQLGYRNKFASYDYGSKINQELYNTTDPPLYNLTKVTMPVALLVGMNDYLSTIKDVTRLRQELPNVVYYHVNPRLKFNHIDFVWGRNMDVYLFPYIYNVLRIYDHVL